MKSSCHCSDVLGPRTEAQRCFSCPLRTTTIDPEASKKTIETRRPSLRHCEAVLSLATTSAMWFNDADDWYEALATVMNERAPA